MPEGPEIRREADKVEKALQKGPIIEIYTAFERLKAYENLLSGSEVNEVATKGKAMLIHLSSGYTIYSHNQLYGRWYVKSSYTYPKTNRKLRLALHNEKQSALLYSASDVEIMPTEEIEDHPFVSRVGPDPLSEKVTADMIVERALDKKFRNRRMTSLLLDQHFIGGIGNYLRSEILFAAGVYPDQRPADLSDGQVRKAAEELLVLIDRSYKHKGITTDESVVERAKAEGKAYSEYRHWVFNRGGQPCRVDGTEIIRFTAGSRRCYYCPTCQQK